MVLTPNERIRQFENKQKIISLLALFVLLAVAVIANKLHMEAVAEQSTKFISRMIQTGDFREASMILQEARLDNFKSIRYESTRPGRSFTLPPNYELKKNASLWDRLSTEKVAFQTNNPLEEKQGDQIVFQYGRFNFFPITCVIWFLLNLVSFPQTRFMKRQILKKLESDLLANQSLIKAEIANQVQHNLRTPLAALMRIPSRLPDIVKEDRELLVNSISQIKAITAALENSPKLSAAHDATDLFLTLNRSLREIALTIPTQIHFKYEVSEAIASARVLHIPFEFQALFGNIVNNAVDAIGPHSGYISIACKDLGPEIQIIIQDSGHGISSEITEKIFDKGFSQKSGGSGLGLFHAKYWIETWKGRLQVKSQNNLGSIFTIILPVLDRKSWFLSRLKVAKKDKILIFDDKQVACELWRLRLKEDNLLEQSFIVTNIDDFKKIKSKLKDETVHCFFDYDLGLSKSGIDFLKDFPQAATRCLVTGHFNQSSIREQCEKLRIHLIPKSQITDLPIVII